MGFYIDHHIVAGVTIFGMVADVLGALFLAYDLLGGKKGGPLRTLARVISYGIVGIFLGLLVFALAFPVAVKFHFPILIILGYFGSIGELLGYMSGIGLGIALGYVFSSYQVILFKPRRRSQSSRKVGRFGVWFVLGLICWFTGSLMVPFKSKHVVWSKIVFGLGLGMIVGFMLVFFIRKLMGLSEDPPNEQEFQEIDHPVDIMLEPPNAQLTQFKVRTRRFRIAAGLAVGFLMGVLFWLGGVITLGFKLVQGFASGLVVGLIGGIINGFVYGFLVRRFLVQDSDKAAPVKPKSDKFGILIGIVVTTATAFFYALVVWLFFGGDLKIILLAASFTGIVGGLGGGIIICITPLLEWRVYNLPERRLGFFGAIMIFLGFIIQTLQYWVNLLDLPVR